MRLLTLCTGLLALIVTIVAPKNDGKGLHRFRLGCSHIPQDQKVGVHQVLLIPPHVFWGIIKHLYNVIDHREYYLVCRGVADGHSKVIVYLIPCDGHVLNLLYSASMSARTLEKMPESICKIFRSSKCQKLVHCLTLNVLFITHQS